jgi:hypothetical protein
MDDVLTDATLGKILKLLVAYQVVALVLIAGWTYVTFDKDDWTLIGVPQMILEWALIGAVAGSLYRLSTYPRLSPIERAELYLWVLAKPFVGVALGAVIYFLSVGGVLVLNGEAKVVHKELLAALAFFAAFSDKFAFSVLDRLASYGQVSRKKSG